MYDLNNRQEKEDSLDVVTGMNKVFDYTVYALLDLGQSLSFVTSYVVINFNVITEHLSELLSISTPIGESIQEKRVYHDCPVSVNHKRTMADLIELDMIEFYVIFCMDLIHSCYASLH